MINACGRRLEVLYLSSNRIFSVYSLSLSIMMSKQKSGVVNDVGISSPGRISGLLDESLAQGYPLSTTQSREKNSAKSLCMCIEFSCVC